MTRISLSIMSTAAIIITSQTALAGDPFPNKPSPNIVVPAVQFGTYGAAMGQFNQPDAIAISDDNIIYIAECANNRVQLFSRFGKSISVWAAAGSTPMNCPQGVGVAENGDVFVAEKVGRILHFSKAGTYLGSFGQHGQGLGQLNSPGRLAVQRGKVYVTDAGNDRIDVFDVTGKPLLIIGQAGADNGSFQDPGGVAVDSDDNVYVVDRDDRIQRFDADGRFEVSWGSYGGMPGQLAEPTDISVVSDRLFVADTVNHRLQAFDLGGKVKLVWGRHPETPHQGFGHTHYPSSIRVSPDGSFAVVCEPFENRCQLFEMNSIVAMANENTNAWWEKFPRFHYGARAKVSSISTMTTLRNDPKVLSTMGLVADDVPRQILVITEPDLHRVVAFSLDAPLQDLLAKAKDAGTTSVELPIMYSIGTFGHGPGQFSTLAAVSLTSEGALLAGDSGNNNIQEFNAISGRYSKTLFGTGSAAAQFHGPSGAVQVASGDLFVGDFHNDRIQVFDQNYNFKFRFGKTGAGRGELFGPIDVAAGPDGDRVYVVDQGNHRIQVFNLKGEPEFEFGRETRPGEWGNGTFQSPFAIAIAKSGNVYVSDESLQLIEKFNAKGDFVKQWGGWGTAPGQFYKPKGVAVDNEENVYVVDFGNHRGQIFNKDGEFLATFGEGVLYPAR